MPDIDTDFAQNGRDRVVRYVTERYGQGSVARIGTFGKLLVIAGSLDYAGAALLVCRASGRAGAGLVTLAVPESLQLASNRVAVLLRQLDPYIALRLNIVICLIGSLARNKANRNHVSSDKIDCVPTDLAGCIDEVSVVNV